MGIHTNKQLPMLRATDGCHDVWMGAHTAGVLTAEVSISGLLSLTLTQEACLQSQILESLSAWQQLETHL